MNASEIILSLMRKRGLSFAQLGRLTGKRREVIYKMIGREDIRETAIKRISEALNEDIFFLMSSKAIEMEAAFAAREAELQAANDLLTQKIAELEASKLLLSVMLKECRGISKAGESDHLP
jgi:hypothetical protein